MILNSYFPLFVVDLRSSRKEQTLLFLNTTDESIAVSEAEIIWALHTIMSHGSFNGAAEGAKCFKKMFPDSKIAQNFTLGRTKLAYNILYGLCPYFLDELNTMISKCSHFVVGFDESLNKIAQKGQMDLCVRFWLGKNVVTRYYNSTFLNHANAENLLDAFLGGLKDLNLRKLLQVSMDGPNVNKKFYKLLKAYLADDNSRTLVLLEMGSCGLHTTHNSFKTPFEHKFLLTKWPIKKFLVAAFFLFYNTPSRRGDYIEANSKFADIKFPLRFCSTRWVENADVAHEGQIVLPYLKNYVEFVKKNNIEPTCKSYANLIECLADPLLEAKLAFFESFSILVEPFLTFFQSDAPLAPFLYERLYNLIEKIMKKIVRKEILSISKSLKDIDLKKEENLISISDLELPFAVLDVFAKNKKSGHFDLPALKSFRKDVRTIYTLFCKKMLDKSPLTFSLTKAISCLDPAVAVHENLRDRRMQTALQIFVKNHVILPKIADEVKEQFGRICTDESFIDSCRAFVKKNKNGEKLRLDDFWVEKLVPLENYDSLYKFFQVVFILSHGNASSERGFSVNKEIIEHNMKEKSLIAQRVIYDAVKSRECEVWDLVPNKNLVSCVKKSHKLYTEALKEQKSKKLNDEESAKQKKLVNLKIKELEAQKKVARENFLNEQLLLDKELDVLKNAEIRKKHK